MPSSWASRREHRPLLLLLLLLLLPPLLLLLLLLLPLLPDCCCLYLDCNAAANEGTGRALTRCFPFSPFLWSNRKTTLQLVGTVHERAKREAGKPLAAGAGHEVHAVAAAAAGHAQQGADVAGDHQQQQADAFEYEPGMVYKASTQSAPDLRSEPTCWLAAMPVLLPVLPLVARCVPGTATQAASQAAGKALGESVKQLGGWLNTLAGTVQGAIDEMDQQEAAVAGAQHGAPDVPDPHSIEDLLGKVPPLPRPTAQVTMLLFLPTPTAHVPILLPPIHLPLTYRLLSLCTCSISSSSAAGGGRLGRCTGERLGP